MNIIELFYYPWAIWLIGAVLMAILEVTLSTFTFAFLSFAAVIASITAVFGDWPFQMGAFAVALVVSVIFVRPKLVENLQKDALMPSRAGALVGMKGEVTEAIDPVIGTGRVLIAGHDWAARCPKAVGVGQIVEIVSYDGIVLIVKEI